jgi:hypothetical protein
MAKLKLSMEGCGRIVDPRGTESFCDAAGLHRAAMNRKWFCGWMVEEEWP